jgi:hypothetical protein
VPAGAVAAPARGEGGLNPLPDALRRGSP